MAVKLLIVNALKMILTNTKRLLAVSGVLFRVIDSLKVLACSETVRRHKGAAMRKSLIASIDCAPMAKTFSRSSIS
jgi:hypothetical protein